MKVFKKILLILAAMALLALGFFFGKEYVSKNQDVENEEISEDSYEEIEALQATIKESYPEKSQRIDFPDNNNFFTIPGKDKIIQTDLGQYVDGELFVDVDLEEFDENIFEKYGANIIGKCDIWGGYQVSIPNKTIDELEAIAKEIANENGVLISEVHWIIPTQANEYEYPDDNFKIYRSFLSKINFFAPNFNKNNLWDDYSIDDGYDKLSKINKPTRIDGKNPYWAYKATNLPYMWENMEYNDPVNIGVFERGKLSISNKNNNFNKDLTYEDLALTKFDGEMKAGFEERYKDAIAKEKGHVFYVSSTLAAKHNNIGFSGISKNSKIYNIYYAPELLPYMLVYSIYYSAIDRINIFNISYGFNMGLLYSINANNEILERDKTNYKLAKALGIKKKDWETFVSPSNEDANKDKEKINNAKNRLNLALRKMKDEGKDFLIVQSAGNNSKEIAKVESLSNVRIEKTTIFDDLDSDLRDHVIIVGASAPKFDGVKTYFNEYSTTKNVDIVAPGENIPGYDENGNVILWSGTSAAAPFVSGLASNLYGAFPDKMNGPLAKKLIIESGNMEVIDSRNGRNSKLVDAKKLTDFVIESKENTDEKAKEETNEETNEETSEKTIEAKTNDFNASPNTEYDDLGFIKLYRDIINNKIPYTKYEDFSKYIKESYYNEDLKFGICKVSDFKYPLLVLSASHEGYNWYSIVQYTGNGNYNTCLYMEPAQVDLPSNYVYTFEDTLVFIDNQLNDEIYLIGKIDNVIKMLYGYSKTIQGPADVSLKLLGIDKDNAEAFDEESYNELVSRLKPVKMYPMNDKTYMEVIDKYKSGQSNGDVARESLYNLTINNPYTNKISYHELSVIEKDSLYYLDVNDYNKFSMEDSPYMTDPELKKYKDPYLKVLEANDSKYIKKNEDGTYYFCLYPGFLPTDDPNYIEYQFQYFPKYGATCFAYKDYMKEEEVTVLKCDYPGIIYNDKLYLEADFLSWWMDFIYDINPTNKTINITEEGHDIGEEGVDYMKIPTSAYNSMEELLEDNFSKLDKEQLNTKIIKENN